MAVTLEMIHKDMQDVKEELSFLRHIMEEDYELSNDAVRRLEKARQEMKSGKYISHEQIKAKYS